MNNLYLEGKEIRVTQLASRDDLNNITFIALDLESTGIHTYTKDKSKRSLNVQFWDKQQKETKEYLQKQGKTPEEIFKTINDLKRKSKEMKVEIAEIAAIAFKYNKGTAAIIKKFHTYVKFSEAMPQIYEMISWNQEKEKKAIERKSSLEMFGKWLNSFPNPRMIIAHNAPYDISLLLQWAKEDSVSDLSSEIKKIPFIDTKKTSEIRKVFTGLLPKKEIEVRGEKKTIENNTLKDLIGAFAIKNEKAHTAIEDTQALVKLFSKLLVLSEAIRDSKKSKKLNRRIVG